MARNVTPTRKWVFTILAWGVAFIIFFPILWMVITSFKTEADAVATPPKFLFFHWTFENYHEVQSRSDYFSHFLNSVIIAVGSTIAGLIVAVFLMRMIGKNLES